MAYIFRFNLPLNSLSIKSYFQLHSQTFKPFTCTKGIMWSYVYSCDKIVYFCPQCYIQPSGIEINLQKLCKGNLVISFEIWDLLTLIKKAWKLKKINSLRKIDRCLICEKNLNKTVIWVSRKTISHFGARHVFVFQF